MQEKSAQKRVRGQQGEAVATAYLEAERFTIVERNFRGKRGEIDIIAMDIPALITCSEGFKGGTVNEIYLSERGINTVTRKHLLHRPEDRTRQIVDADTCIHVIESGEVQDK